MNSTITKPEFSQPVGDTAVYLFDDWFDPIEAQVRERVRGFIHAMIEGELDERLQRPRYGRRAKSSDGENGSVIAVSGHRHGHRTRSLTGTFGTTNIKVPRARLTGPDGKTTEWKSKVLRTYQRRTLTADALIASAYLSGTNTRRVRRALKTLFAHGVGKDVVSRVWRKVKSDWEAWNARSLAAEPIVRLILDGTVVRVRLDRKATAISLLVVIGVRTDGQKVLPCHQEHGRREQRSLARGSRRPDQARPATTAVPHRRRCSGPRKGDCRRLGERAGATLHGAQT